jgi:hypothetical protein
MPQKLNACCIKPLNVTIGALSVQMCILKELNWNTSNHCLILNVQNHIIDFTNFDYWS